MRLLESESSQVRGVAKRWRAAYFKNETWGSTIVGDSQIVYQKLAAIGRDATAEDVADIIGNDSWIGTKCNECGRQKAIVLVGEEPDYESATVHLCADCIHALQRLISEPASVPAKENT